MAAGWIRVRKGEIKNGGASVLVTDAHGKRLYPAFSRSCEKAYRLTSIFLGLLSSTLGKVTVSMPSL